MRSTLLYLANCVYIEEFQECMLVILFLVTILLVKIDFHIRTHNTIIMGKLFQFMVAHEIFAYEPMLNFF
jgi:hypothetical protein